MKTTLASLWITLTVILMTFTGCKKELEPFAPESGSKKGMNELNIPEGFDWKTTREITLNLGVNDAGMPVSLHRITLYDDDPFSGGNPIFSGAAGNGMNLVAKVSVPLAMQNVFLALSSSGAIEQVVSLETASALNYTFEPLGDGLKSLTGTLVTGPDCSSGCDQTLSGSGSQTISNGQTYCINSSYNGSINITRGTLKICGAFTGSITMGSNTYSCSLIVTAGGTATITSLSMGRKSVLYIYENSSAVMNGMTMTNDAKVYNYGSFTVSAGGLSSNNLIENEGAMTITGNYSMTTNAIFHNTGSLFVSGTYNSEKEVTNSGIIEVNGNMNLCTQLSNVWNYCRIIVHGNFVSTNCNFYMDQGYLKVDNLTEMKSTCNLTMKNGSMISTNTYKQYQNISGQGSANVIKISGSGSIYNSKKVNGNIEMSTPSGTLGTGGQSNFINGATLVSLANSVVFIPVSECNPEGNSAPPCPDSDGDGVTDCDDDYPGDPAKAFNNYTTGTAVWEDLWPAKGDYDLNDLVNYYRFNLITNSANQVVDVEAKFYARAVGASFHNGFGFQFDNVLPGQISSVTGYDLTQGYIFLGPNGTENGQAKAVVIVWDDAENVIHREGGSFFNTLPGSPVGTSDTITVTVHFSNPLSTGVVGTPPFNPFIIKDGMREIEIHLPDYIPTSLVNQVFFGTVDDDTQPGLGKYYETPTNLPWAINIPAEFNYPFEYTDITLAYNHFASWAESGGLTNLDWYFDLPGYRNAENIFH